MDTDLLQMESVPSRMIVIFDVVLLLRFVDFQFGQLAFLHLDIRFDYRVDCSVQLLFGSHLPGSLQHA